MEVRDVINYVLFYKGDVNMEIWKDIYFIENNVEYDYRGYYQVSDKGNIKSLSKMLWNGYGYFESKERILKLKELPNGYLSVVLYKDGVRCDKVFMIHRLVAHMFLEKDEGKNYVDHINTIRTDNHVENLRWVTHKENMNNSKTVEKFKKANSGRNNPMAKKVAQYDTNGNLIEVYGCIGEVVEKFGVCYKSVQNCCRGKQKTVRYKNEKIIFKFI